MGNGGLNLIDAIRSRLPYCVGDKRVSMGHVGMSVIGANRDSLLYIVGDR